MRLTEAAYGLAAAIAAVAVALLLRLGPDAAGATAERHLALLAVATGARAGLFAVASSRRDGPPGRRLRTLVAITAVGSVVLAALVLGPLAPATRPTFPRSVLVLEAAVSLGISAVLLALPRTALRSPSRAVAVAVVGVVVLLAPMGGGPRWQTFAAPWPPHPIRAEYASRVATALAEWQASPSDYAENLRPYDPRGPYFHYADVWRSADATSRFDADGVPLILIGDAYEYNPVTVAQFALAAHARYLEGSGSLDAVRAGADALLRLEGEDGALRYDYAWRHYLEDAPFEPGWVSSMAQGQALSAFGRAYEVTGDERYLEAGRRAVGFLMRTVGDGGTKSDLRFIDPQLQSRPYFEEFVTDPYAYTLNGYLFTILGLYDWSQLDDEAATRTLAASAFAEGVRSLVGLLPYYDIGGFSAYDLGHLTFPDREPHVVARYHAVHIYLLHALHDITGEPVLHRYELLWRSYVEGLASSSPASSP